MPQAKNAPKTEPVTPADLRLAAEHEAEIAVEAAKLRAEDQSESGETDMDALLLDRLYPLLCKPIHAGHLLTISKGEGKPYPSTGIRSVQIQINRLDNVLRPWWWSEEVEYQEGGKLCRVKVSIGDIFSREAWGGVERANTQGNLRKGSYTNAAKLAFARIGIGSEVYIGATDFDPDVSEEAAAEQAKPDSLPGVETITADQAALLRDHFDAADIPPDELKVKLGAMGVSARSVNKALASLTPAQATDLDGWMAARSVGAEANGSG